MRTLLLLILSCACAHAGLAARFAYAEDAVRSAASSHTVMIDEDFFASGSSAELDRRVDGDAFLSGGRVAVRAPVKGDAVLAGGDVNVADTVGQDLYAAGGSIVLSAQVVGNARIAGAQVTIAPRGGIAGRAMVAAKSLRMSGRVGRYLIVYAESVRVDGEVGGDLRITARSIEIGPEAKIGGKLEYRSAQPATIDAHAVIAGGVVRNDWSDDQAGALARAAAWISLVLVLLGLLVVGVLLIGVFPRFSMAAAATVRAQPWASAAVGFALLLCVPVAAMLLLISLIGATLGLLLLFFYPVMLLLGYLIGVLSLGDLVMGWWARRQGRMLTPARRCVALAAALLLLWLAASVPVAGAAVVMLLLLLGLGGFWIEIYRGYPHVRATPVPSADMQTE